MFSRDGWNEIIESLSSNVFRTLLTAFGVFWGIFLLVILLAAGKGLENGVKKSFSGIAANSMFMWTMPTSKPYKGLPQGRTFTFVNSDITGLRDNFPELKYISPRNQLGGMQGANNVVRGLRSAALPVYGDYPEYFFQMPMGLVEGRFINRGDIVNKTKVAIIGTGVIKELYETEETVVGTYIKVNGVNFMVIGVYKNNSNFDGNPEEGQKHVYIPFTTFQQVFNMGEQVGWMALTARDDIPITDLKDRISGFLKKRHEVHPDDERAIGNFDLYAEFEKINGLFVILSVIAFFVGILVLLSGVIGISNIMLIVVKERTKEIGIRRALGATPWNIRAQILSESIVLTAIAGIAGITFGTGILAIVNKLLDNIPSEGILFANPSVDLSVITLALLILIFFGLLAGFIPAQTAIRIKPVDALRSE